ncbi:MAG: hypothetical protein EHM35_13465 [Planctomycetaceae bacterium]|jgi:uncharacterized protein (DUF169 family)|nr:MAG: hypothetical protein EHM35_13465 [Planctomycetaceae bacterium]
MADYSSVEQRLSRILRLRNHPVAVTFRDTAPAGVPQFTGTEPSSCSFWRLAAEGRTFHTVAADHYNCPIGSYTHNVPLPPARADDLNQTLGLMTEIGYVKMDELPNIPRLPRTPGVIIYAPLATTPVDPDVVVVSAQPGRLMMLHEAALRAGADVQAPLFGRPTCMAVPAALSMGVVSSIGCIGNRIYTDLPDDELYMTIPGKDVARVADELGVIKQANTVLSDYHRARREALTSQ